MPNRTSGRFAAVAAAAALAGTAPSAGSPPPQVVGINAAVLNIARIRSAGTPQARLAVVRERVALADEVQTGARSQLQLLLLDRSTFTVGANARLTIDRYVYDPNRSVRSMSAKIVTGAFRFVSGRPNRAGSSTINTPVAAIGIRGTIVEGVVGEAAMQIARGESAVGPGIRSESDTASLIILRGPGPWTQGNSRIGSISVEAGNYPAIVLDRPMLAVYVPAPGAAPIGPFAISRGGLMRVQALLFPALAERLNLPLPMAGAGNAPRVGGLPSETRNLPASALRDADPNWVPTVSPTESGFSGSGRRGQDWLEPPGKGATSGGRSEPRPSEGYGGEWGPIPIDVPRGQDRPRPSGAGTTTQSTAGTPSGQTAQGQPRKSTTTQSVPQPTPTPTPSPAGKP
jgi:hypothetical protein